MDDEWTIGTISRLRVPMLGPNLVICQGTRNEAAPGETIVICVAKAVNVVTFTRRSSFKNMNLCADCTKAK